MCALEKFKDGSKPWGGVDSRAGDGVAAALGKAQVHGLGGVEDIGSVRGGHGAKGGDDDVGGIADIECEFEGGRGGFGGDSQWMYLLGVVWRGVVGFWGNVARRRGGN